MSGEATIFLICCAWPFLGVLAGWWLRGGAYEKRRLQA